MERILFLDVDGVLNNRATARSWCGPDALDSACCMRLHRVCEATLCRVVLSSSWRYVTPLPEMRRYLEVHGARVVFLDRTPFAPEMPRGSRLVPIPGHKHAQMYATEVRGLEIQRWIDLHRDLVGAFAIVDDDADMAHLEHRLVRTSMETGLTDADADRLIALLSEAA